MTLYNDLSGVTGDFAIAGELTLAGYQDFAEIAAPANPAGTVLRLWAESQNGLGQLHFKNAAGLDHELSRDNLHTVRNNTGSTIAKGKWVYISGSTGVTPTVALAKADSPSTLPAFGVVVADIPNNSFGQVMTMGDVQNVDTSAFIDGDVLYISAATAGETTTTRATGTNQDQRVGVVIKSSVGAGIIAVLIGGAFDPSTTTTFSNKTFITPILGVASATSETINGTGGNGFLSLGTQSSNPSAPAGGTVLFSNSNSRFSWRGSANTFVKTFDGSAATADRIYLLPDAAGTVALTANIATQAEVLIVAVGDETTALTTGVAKTTFRVPFAMTLTAVRASVTTAPTGGTLLTVDVNEGGTSVLSTKLTFDASEKTTTTAATPAVISDVSLADDAEITIDIDAVGSTIAGAGLKVTLIGTRT